MPGTPLVPDVLHGPSRGAEAEPRLVVLNPAGREAEQRFHDGAGPVDDRIHAPINFHAYAASTLGAYLCSDRAIPLDQRNVLVLLRRDLRPALAAVRRLRQRGHVVAVTWKETALSSIAGQLSNSKQLQLFQEICRLASGAVSSTADLPALYTAAGAKAVRYIPTPYPVHDERWDFQSPAKRVGVFIGTRQITEASRNHLLTLSTAKLLGAPITVVNTNGRSGTKWLRAIGIPELTIIEGRLPYSVYVGELAKHRLVFQLDRSGVPGQVAGDALLARTPCVGGDGATEQIVYPESCGIGRSFPECLKLAQRVLHDDAFSDHLVARARTLASKHISFPVIARELSAFFNTLS